MVVVKKKILMLSDSVITNTGYATITRNILNGLSDEYECHALCHNFHGQTLPPGVTFKDGTKLNFWIHGAGREGYCKDLIIPKIKEIGADYFIVLLDTFMLYPWILDFNFYPAKSIFYFPSDGGGGMPQGCELILQHFNKAVAMARFGQRQAKEVHGLNTEYIPHAIDENIFRPLSELERNKIKSEMEVVGISGNKVKGFLKDKFVIGCISRNQGRKMLDREVKAFAEFCKDKPDAVLYMHSDPFDGAAVFDIRALIQRHGIANRVCFSPMKYYENFEYKDMNKVYACMDVFFLSTSGEGFGIPTLEAQACGIPTVVTDYTTTQELLIEDGVCGIPAPLESELTGSWNVERGIMNIPKAAEILTKLYNEPELRKQLGKVGREKALKLYTWEENFKLWKNLLKRMDDGD